MDTKEFTNRYWEYYYLLEKSFLESCRYVSLHENNKDTFSIEFVKQILEIGSEIDVVAKGYSRYLVPFSDHKNIHEYAKAITSPKSDFTDCIIEVKDREYKNNLTPWAGWTTSKSPTWWGNYNSVKHHRSELDAAGNEIFHYADQSTVLNALAGLFQLELFFYRDLANDEMKNQLVPLPISNLFAIKGWQKVFSLGGNSCIFIDEKGYLNINTKDNL